MAHLVWSFLLALATVAWRRARLGPKRPTWSFGFEVLVGALRLHTRWQTTLPIPALRRATRQLKGRLAPGVVVNHEQVGTIPMTWFTPQEPTDGVILYLHGGGHVFGSAAQDGAIASELARVANVRVAAPDFRLAPEAPYPAGVEDVIAVYDALRKRATSGVALAGLSSGAGLALAAMLRLRDEGRPTPSRAVLLSPMVDATGTTTSWSTNADVDWGVPEVLRWAKLYAGTRDASDPGVSPVNAKLDGLPPLLVVAGDAELLRDDAVILAERGRAAGVDVTLHVEPDMVHAFMSFGRNDEPTRRTLDLVACFLSK